MNGTLSTTVTSTARRTALPLAAYYGVTLAIPIINGAQLSGAFLDHATTVVLVPLAAIALSCAVQFAARVLVKPSRDTTLSRFYIK